MLKFVTPIALLLSVQSTFASQNNGNLSKRDACEGTDAIPILYHGCLDYFCPPKYELNSERVCDHIVAENFCAAYCQLSTVNSFYLWTEFPLGPWCEGPCNISNFARKMTWPFNDINYWRSFEEAMNAGISGGWQFTITANVGPQGLSLSSPSDEGQCGYWSWVPIKRTVW
jgi:hypothetical protein